MNLFSRFKKIFLIVSFLVFVWGGVAVGAANHTVVGTAFKVSSVQSFQQIQPGSVTENGDSTIETVSFNLGKDVTYNGTDKKSNFTRQSGAGAALAEAYKNSGKDLDKEDIDWGNAFVNKSASGNTYLQDNGDGTYRVLAVAVGDNTYIPATPIKDKQGSQAGRFLNDVEADSGLTKGSLYDAYGKSDNSGAQEASNQQRTDRANAELTAAQLALEKAQKEYDDAVANNSDDRESAEGRLTAAQGRFDAAKSELKNAQDLQASVTRTTALNEEKCELGSKFSIKACLLDGFAWIALKAFSLSSWVLAKAGQLLDYSIELSVNSAEFLQSLAIVNPMWAFVRDMLNMTFIFILLFIAINMVLGNAGLGGKTYTIKNDVRNVVIVAILINFSLFFAKLMVDGSNLLTLEIYQQMKPEKVAGTPQGGISDQIMNTVGLTSLVNIKDVFTQEATLPPGCENFQGVSIAVGVFGTIFVLVLAVAFGLSAILFFIRLPNMVYLFISSPLWIWGYAMKGGIFEKMKKEWSENMFHLCTFPIVYMLWMFGGIFAFKQLLGAKGPEGTFLKVLCENPTGGQLTKTLSVFIVFFIVIIVMMKAIKYAMTKGAGTGVGAGLAQKAIARADSVQKGLTSGLYNKAKDKTVGAAKFVGSAIAAPAKVGLRLAADKTSNGIANMLGNAAANRSNPLARKILSGVSQKFRDPKVFGSTQKEYGTAREKKAKENHASYIKTLKDSGVFKIESSEDFLQANPNKTSADYDAYVEAKAKTILKSQLGEKMMNHKEGTSTQTYQEEILHNMYDVDANGIRKFNPKKLWSNISAKQTYHTTGKGKKNPSFAGTMATSWDQGGRRGKGRAAATTAFTREQEAGGALKEREQKKLQALREEITKLPSSELDLENIVNGRDFSTNPHPYSKGIKDYAAEQKKLAVFQANPIGANVDKINETKEKIKKIAQKVLAERDTTISKADKLEERIAKMDADKDKK